MTETTKATGPKAPVLTVKTTPAVIARIDALLPWAERQIDVVSSGHATRSDVLRAALASGLESLERRAKRDAGGGDS